MLWSFPAGSGADVQSTVAHCTVYKCILDGEDAEQCRRRDTAMFDSTAHWEGL